MARDEDLLIEQIAKTKAERTKCELETKEIQDRLTTPWYRRAHIVQAIAAGLVAVPIIWFYVKEVAIPLSMSENNRLALSNSRKEAEIKAKEEEIKKANEENKKNKIAYNEKVEKYIEQNEDLQIAYAEYKKKAEDLQQQFEVLSEKYNKLEKQSASSQEKEKFIELASRTRSQAAALKTDIQQAVDANKRAELRTETIVTTIPNGGDGTHGFIWIGNYDQEGSRWTTTRLKGIENLKPGEIQTNATYAVSGNMTLRAEMPKNNTDYFRGVESIGYIPKGTPVKIIDLPKSFDRETKIQYWVEVERSK